MPETALTAAISLNLATPQALQKALALLGITWDPRPFNEIPKSSEEGLYTWVIGAGDSSGLLTAPIGYIGIGASKYGGLYGRLRDEIRLAESAKAEPEWSFLHPRAMARLNGKPVGGSVSRADEPDLSWLNDLLSRQPADRYEIVERAFNGLREWLKADDPAIVKKAERLCVRAAAYLGDCAPPVNCHYATAWEVFESYEWGGWAAAQRLLGLPG
jgi:hypothetical protein